MKSLTEHLWFEVPNRRGFINITDTVASLVKKSGVQEGLCLVNAMHITASVFINDAEDGLLHDYEVCLEKLAPHEPTSHYHHNRTGEDTADAHLKRQIMGREVVIAITKGKLDLGPWEQIFYGEFDGRRRKRVLVKIIGEGGHFGELLSEARDERVGALRSNQEPSYLSSAMSSLSALRRVLLYRCAVSGA